MITYNPKDWWKLIFAFHRSDSFRMLLPGMVAVGVYTAGVAYLETQLFHVTFRNTTLAHSLIGFVLSMLLIFRTNTAYDRWWEGRRLWGGLVNTCRNLALKLQALLGPEATADRAMFRALILNFVVAAKEHLRQGVQAESLQAAGSHPVEAFLGARHVPNRILAILFSEVIRLQQSGRLTGEQLLFLNAELQSFADTLGACERIRKTPIPYAYSLFLKKIIFLYVFTMPIGFVLDYGYWAVPVVAFVFYAFASIEVIAEEIEDPFGTDANDLPLDSISDTIRANLEEIL